MKIPRVVSKRRDQKEEKRNRTVRLDPEHDNMVKSFPDRTGAKTEQESIRDAIVFYNYVLDAIEFGHEIVLINGVTKKQRSLFVEIDPP